MNIDQLKVLLRDHNTIVKETTKNFIVHCCYCGDHPNPRKKGHLYVSKDPNVPVVHCFFCNHSTPLEVFLFDITGDKKSINLVVSKEELERYQRTGTKSVKKSKSTNYVLPEIDHDSFNLKRAYIKKRANFCLEPQNLPGLIFNFEEFFSTNKLTDKMIADLGNRGLDMMQNKFVGFLSRNQSMIYCRCIDSGEYYQFRKISLQEPKFGMLDYVCFPGNNPKSNVVVLAEGTFDILGEYVSNSLNMNDKVRLFAAGQSYSYSSLIKSVSFDENLFKMKVIILSDRDKKVNWYSKFVENNKHIIDTVKFFYNKAAGGDFGSYPIRPFEMRLNPRYKKY